MVFVESLIMKNNTLSVPTTKTMNCMADIWYGIVKKNCMRKEITMARNWNNNIQLKLPVLLTVMIFEKN